MPRLDQNPKYQWTYPSLTNSEQDFYLDSICDPERDGVLNARLSYFDDGEDFIRPEA